MDLFDYMREQNQKKESPLASRLRPVKLEEVVGQQHIIGKDNCCTVLFRRISSVPLFFTDRQALARRPWPK